MAYRVDSVRVDAATRTPSGGLKVDAYVTRTGIFEYRKSDGSVFKELRLPEEVFHPDSLASLEDAAVTVEHPPEMVTSKNWRKYAAGYVHPGPAREPGEGVEYIKTKLAVQDGDAVQKIGTDLIECSCGYLVDVDPTPGVWEGQHYDGVQRNIRYNHVALGPRDWGRAGNEVRVRAYDSAMEIRTDAPSAVDLEAMRSELATARADADTLRKELAEALKSVEQVKADSEKARVESETLLNTRNLSLSIASDVFRILGRVDSDPEKAMRDCIEKVAPQAKKDLTGDALRAVFDHVVATSKNEEPSAEPLTAAADVTNVVELPRKDARDAYAERMYLKARPKR